MTPIKNKKSNSIITIAQIIGDKMKKEFEEFNVDFKIISNKNDEVYIEGYVTINDEEAEDVDWYYWNGSGYNNNMIIWHDGVQISGSTFEQENEIEQFRSDLIDDNEWITDVILQSNENENYTFKRENLTLVINEGAKFKIKYKDYSSISDYCMAFELFFNNEKVYLNEDIYFEDPDTYQGFKVGEDIPFENGAYIIEIPKSWWEDPTVNKKEIINDYKEAFEKAYVKSLVRELCVFEIAYDFIKEEYRKQGNMKVFDEAYLQECANACEDNFEEMNISEISLITKKDVKKIIQYDYEEELQLKKEAQKEYELEQKELEKEFRWY